MPVPRAQLGGMFGGGTQPVQTAPPDIAGAIGALTSGVGSILHQRYLIRQAQQNQEMLAQQRQQMNQDRQAQLEISRMRMDLERSRDERAAQTTRDAAARSDRDFQFKQDQANKPKAHYDATSGKFVYEDGHSVQAGTPKPAAAPHIDPLSPEGIRASVERRKQEAVIETPSQRIAAQAALLREQASQRAADAATLHEKNAAVSAAKGDVDEITRSLPRPSKVPAQVLGKDAKGRSALVANPARAQVAADSAAMDRTQLQPARIRYGRTVDALAGPATPAPAPAPAGQPTGDINLGTPPAAPRIRVPGAAPAATPKRIVTADQAAFLQARGKWNPALYEVR